MINGPTDVCSNSLINYSFVSGYTTYHWTITGGIITSGQGTNSIWVDWDDNENNGLVELTVDSAPYDLNVNIYHTPTPTVSGENTCCSGDEENYSTSYNSGNDYSWTVFGGTITSGIGTHSITVQWGSDNSVGTVQVFESNLGGCVGPSNILYVAVHPLPQPSISGSSSVLEYSEKTYYVENTFSSYDWQISGGTISSGQGTHQVVVEWGTLNPAASISVEVSNANGCINQDSLVLNIMTLDNLSERFVETYDPSMQPAMTDLLLTIHSGAGINSLPEMLGLDQSLVSQQLAGLNAGSDYVVGYSNWLHDQAESINNNCITDSEKQDRFFGIQGEEMRSALEWYVNDVLAENIEGFVDWKSLITTPESEISDQYSQLSCGSPLKQSSANSLLISANSFLDNLSVDFNFFGALKDEHGPIAGLTIQVIDRDNNDVLIGQDISDSNGLVSFSISDYLPAEGLVPNRNVDIEVYTQNGILVDTLDLEVDPYGDPLLDLTISTPPQPADDSPNIEAIETIIGATYPTGFLTYLTGKGIESLKDIRDFGGISHFDDLPENVTPQLTLLLEQYASLDSVINDIDDCVIYHDAGFLDAVSISNAPRAVFIDTITAASALTSTAVGLTHSRAQTTVRIDLNVQAGAIATTFNNYLGYNDNSVFSPDSLQIKDLIVKKCDCSDCRTAVSPAAYLAALLDYTVKNVLQHDGSAISLTFLEEKFFQPFGKLTASCENENERVCQVRVCIDVLTAYIIENDLDSGLDSARLEFYKGSYNQILIGLGTSFNEIQQIPNFTNQEKASFAQRIGIPEECVNNTVFSLEIFANTPSVASIDAHLEEYFGLSSLLKNPLSQGSVDQLIADQIISWEITGIRWNFNTSIHGVLFGTLYFDDDGPDSSFIIQLYSDSGKSSEKEVCRGAIKVSDGVINLTPVNNSGVFGVIEINYTANITEFQLQLIPKIACYRLEKINSTWRNVDYQPLPNPYLYFSEALQEGRTHALIDPDIISSDDIRNPFPQDPSRVSAESLEEIYSKRIEWLSERKASLLAELFPVGEDDEEDEEDKPNFGAVYTKMEEALEYKILGSTPVDIYVWTNVDPADFQLWFDTLQGKVTGNVDDIIEQIKSDLNLTPASFCRFFEISKSFPVSVEKINLTLEQRELINEFLDIMLLAQKNAANTVWMTEEEDNEVVPNQYLFQKSITEPKVGTWPPLNRIDIPGLEFPMVDPIEYSMGDFMDEFMLNYVYEGSETTTSVKGLYITRNNQLISDRNNIQAFQESIVPSTEGPSAYLNGFECLLKFEDTDTFGDVKLFHFDHDVPNIEYSAHLLQLWEEYNGDDAGAKQAVITKVHDELKLTLAEYEQLMNLYLINKLNPNGLSQPEWNIVYDIVLKGASRKNHYTGWITDEGGDDLELNFWQVFKQRLNLWRGSQDQRNLWLKAILISVYPPIIDPDNISPDYFLDIREPEININPEYFFWNQRNELLDDWQTELTSEDLDEETNFNDAVLNYIGKPIDYLINLYNSHRTENINPKLEQLTISFNALQFLAEYHNELQSSTPDEQMVNTLIDILIQVRKIRNNVDTEDIQDYFTWRADEFENHIYVKPSSLCLPQQSFGEAYFSSSIQNIWRSNSSVIKNRNQTLGSRIEQESTTRNRIKEDSEDAQDNNIVKLRDALARMVNPELSLSENADWITDNLLIDAKVQCCQPTTRIAQAIETVQTFLFSIRTDTLDISPILTIKNDTFDDDWKWLGSYGAWRSLMFMYLYPENILDPTFRSTQTNVFRQITNELLNDSRITPAKTDAAMKEYYSYFKDIATISAVASCAAIIKGKTYYFIFGKGSETNKVYWTNYIAMGYQPDDQKIWNPVPGLENGRKVLGCVPFTVRSGARYVYVFSYSISDKSAGLLANRFNLDTETWESEPLEFDLDPTLNPESGIVEQTYTPDQLPYLAFLTYGGSKSKRLTAIQLNRDGSGFDPNIKEVEFWTGNLESLIRIKDGFQFFITKNNSGKYFECFRLDLQTPTDRPIKPSPDGSFTKIHVPPSVAGLAGIGAIYDPSTNFIRFFFKNSTKYTRFVNINAANAVADPITRFGYKIDYIGPQLPYSKYVVFNGADYKTGVWAGILPTSMLTHNYRLSPVISSPFELKRKLNLDELQNIRVQAEQQYKLNQDYSEALNIYIQEAYYFFPIFLALNLQKSNYFIEALDWFKTTFDYSVDRERRKIYYGLKSEENWNNVYNKANEWLKDPKDPHRIAATRQLSYTRYTILSLIQCILEFADSEFTRDTAESVPRARTMYLTAIDLLNEEVYGPLQESCSDIINRLDPLITDTDWWVNWLKIKTLALKVSDLMVFTKLVTDEPGPSIKSILLDELTWVEKFEAIRELIETTLQQNKPFPNYTELLDEERIKQFKYHLAGFSSQEMTHIVSNAQTLAVNDFARGVAVVENITVEAVLEDLAQYNWLTDVYVYPVTLSDSSIIHPTLIAVENEQSSVWKESKIVGFQSNISVTSNYLPYVNTNFCVPTNPMAEYQLFHAEISLYKIRNCMNINGLKRELSPYAAPTNAYSGLPLIGTTNLASAANGIPRNSTLYRYQFLIERAKQTLSIAQQLESTLLATLEKRDAEAYSLLRAKQDIGLTKQSIKLQDLRLVESRNYQTLAELQRDRSQIQIQELDNMINAGLNSYEQGQIIAYTALAVLKTNVIQSAAAAKISEVITLGSNGAVASSGASVITAAAAASSIAIGSISDIVAIGIETGIQALSINAQFERRKQDWEFQKVMANQDLKIGDQQILLAKDRIKIVEQEKSIAELQNRYAEDTLNFLTNKFTNRQLYEWMLGIIQRAYNFFLQQATAQAKLAQIQLAFERQEGEMGLIQEDYYSPPSDGISNNGTDSDRRGLTGSTRLLVDLAKLENYAFDNNKRKNQLTKTLSLRSLFPSEFLNLQERGIMNFATTMEQFDRDFPGHYLRLIRQVRVSVIALIPPAEGIKATLYNSGTSRVAVKSGFIVQTVNSTRLPESVAYTAPIGSNGLFELYPDNSLFYAPFEGTGVDTSWQFELLKGSNPFDFNTLVDVILTIEYTSLSDSLYRSQVFKQLNQNLNANASRFFSIKEVFPDSWYDFNNPELDITHSTFEILRTDFPVNVSNIQNQSIRLFFRFKNNEIKNLNIISLEYSSGNQEQFNSVIKDLSLDATSENPLPQIKAQTDDPNFLYGKWRLGLSNQITDLIKSGELEDIIMIIDYSAEKERFPNV